MLSSLQKVSLTEHEEENYQALGEIRISFCGLPFISVIKLILKEKKKDTQSIVLKKFQLEQ